MLSAGKFCQREKEKDKWEKILRILRWRHRIDSGTGSGGMEPEVSEPQVQVQTKPEQPVLTPAEQKMVEDFAAKIDIENTNQILQYGAGTQKKMADFSILRWRM